MARRWREPGSVTPEEALSAGRDGEKNLSNFFLLLYKCPVTYGLTLLLTDSSAACHRCACSGSSRGCLPCPHVAAIISTHVRGNETGRATGMWTCSLTCFLSGLSRSSLHSRIRIPFCPQPKPHQRPPNSLVLAKLPSVCTGIFLTSLVVSLIAVKFKFSVVSASLLSVACLYCWPTCEYWAVSFNLVGVLYIFSSY